MKTTKFYLILAIMGMLFLQNCKRNNQEETSCNCSTSNLGITDDFRYLNPNQPHNSLENSVWRWNIHSDTLIVATFPTGPMDFQEEIKLYFKIQNDCPVFIKYENKTVNLRDGSVGNENIINQPNFELQEWDNQQRIVGKYHFNANNQTQEYKFWVDFTSQYHYDLTN